MPKEDGVGYGECTGQKLEYFSKIVAMHMAITQAVLNKNAGLFRQHYRYNDLTAGKGFVPKTGEKGSPLVFLQHAEAESFKLPYRADFIEREEKNISELESAIQHEKDENGWGGENHHFHNGEYQSVIPALLHSKNVKEFGLAFVDPSGDPPDFDVLRYIASVRPKMEILIYLSSTNIKRLFHFTEKKLSDYIDQIGKKYWLVRKPVSWDHFKWTFMLGSNTDLFTDYKKVDFFRSDSERGQEILLKLNLTEKELHDLNQPKLF